MLAELFDEMFYDMFLDLLEERKRRKQKEFEYKVIVVLKKSNMFVIITNVKGVSMEYNLDKPIENEQEDLLSRNDFAKHFAKDVVMLAEKNNFTIALNGTWGSGKTSLINLIKNEIVRLRDHDEQVSSYPIIIDFAPWNSLDENGIITQFFRSFTSIFTKNKLKEFLKHSKTQFALNLLKDLPLIRNPFKLLKTFYDKYLKEFLEKDKDLLTTKQEIIKCLKKSNYNFIVFIDDIDRLNNSEIKLLFQLIKAVCDFPNVTYVLSYDKGIVANALSNEQTSDGYKYLEKIIQLSIDVPKPLKEDFQGYLFTKMDNILAMAPESEFDTGRWSYIFRNGFYNYFKNLRDVNRYINAVLFKFPSYKGVLNPLDFFTMEAISLFEPQLLNFIKNNKETLCKSSTSYGEDRNKEVEQLQAECNKISNNFELIKYLFPYINTNAWSFGAVGEFSYYNRYKSNGRICYEKHFEFYFAGKLDNESISRMDIVKILKNYDKSNLDHYFKSLNNKSFILFLQYLDGYLKDNMYKDEILNIMPDIISYSKDFKDLSNLLFVGKDDWIFGILDDLFKFKGVETSFDWLIKLFSSNNNYSTLIELLYHLARHTSFYYDNKKRKESYLGEKHILQLHNILTDKLETFIYDDEFLKNYKKIKFIRFLNIRNKEIVKKWIDKQKEKDENLINVIGLSTRYGYGESSERFITYSFPFALFSEHIDIEYYKSKISNLLKSEHFNDIKDDCKVGLVLFIMPERKDDPYQKEEINKFCKDNKINFICEDIFVDT